MTTHDPKTVILSLTTIPNRLLSSREDFGIRPGLKTILEQNYSSYEVHLNIPWVYKVNNTIIETPPWLYDWQQKYPHLKIYRTDDYGPITKIFPTLKRISDPDATIIVVDDDLLYMRDLITYHVNTRQKYPNCALGFAGLSAIDKSCHFCTTVKQDTRVKILEGYKSVSYKRSFFDINDLEHLFMSKSWNDDIVLSAYMGYKDIPKIVISYEGDTDFSPRVESFPVIGHSPVDRGGCYEFRNNQNLQEQSDININHFYKIGYLEK